MSDQFLSDGWCESEASFQDDFELEDPETYESEEETHYQVIGVDQVGKVEAEQAAEISELLSLDKGTSRLLLKAYSWNSKRLLEEFLDGRALQTIGLEETDLSLQQESGITQAKHKTIPFCPICCEEYEVGFELACRHQACASCYRTYLLESLRAGDCFMVKCLADPDCPLKLKAQDFETVGRDLLLTYNTKAAKVFVENHPSSFKTCTRPGCDRIIELKSSSAVLDLKDIMVICSCGQDFCFKCKGGSHVPITCDLATKWLEVSGETIRNQLWIVNNTKPCPKCETRIERTEGCNHMKCGNCHFEFCWMCMQEWAQHAGMFFNCVQFEPVSDEKHSGKATAAKLRHYAARFDSNFTQSQRHTNTREKSFFSQQLQSSTDAALSKARKILAWTYVLLFYTVPSNQKAILEATVSEVEACAEDLAEILSNHASPSVRCVELADRLDSRTEKLTDHVLAVSWKYDKQSLRFTPKQ